MARAGLPVALVAASAFVGPVRWLALVALLAGMVMLRRRADPAAWLWAALALVELRLAFVTVAPSVGASIADCANLLSAPAVARVVEAVVVFTGLAILTLWLRADRRSLSWRLPSAQVSVLAIAVPLLLIPLGLWLGPILARPFFGEIRLELGLPAAILPALLLAGSNGLMEETIFRGAVLGWGSRAIGVAGALVVQALLFGLTHAGPDFVDPIAALPVLAAVTLGGLIAGWIVLRTGSLLLPIAVHVALDVPLYYAFACRLPST
jgi:membrane protease YdiL (CAAX protease family)